MCIGVCMTYVCESKQWKIAIISHEKESVIKQLFIAFVQPCPCLKSVRKKKIKQLFFCHYSIYKMIIKKS